MTRLNLLAVVFTRGLVWSLLGAVLLLFFECSLIASVNASPEVESLKVRSDGSFSFDGAIFAVAHLDASWHRSDQSSLKPSTAPLPGSGGEWRYAGDIRTKVSTEPIQLQELIKRVDGRTFKVSYEAYHPTGVKSQSFCVSIFVPVEYLAGKSVRVDGKSVVMPAKHGEVVVFSQAAGTLVLPTASGRITITGFSRAMGQDNRRWGSDLFEFRLEFPGIKESVLTHTALSLELSHELFKSYPIALVGAANRAFADEKEDDGLGGWTDQGPSNDLSALPAGRLDAVGVTFDIADAAKNKGKSCLVLSSVAQHRVGSRAVVVVAGQPSYSHLYLLHAIAWPPAGSEVIGKVTAAYVDGTSSTHEVKSYRDVGDWWAPSAVNNGAVGWMATNKSAPIGLYVSHFAVETKPIREITFESMGNTMWMIAGLSGSIDEIRLGTPSSDQFQLVESANWKPYNYALEIKPGSVFDFSRLNDAPAGKYGPLTITPDGHFAFAQKSLEPVRFWGVNLCFSANYLTKEWADRTADLLARSGYNVVRFHHYDAELLVKGGNSYELDPAKLDQLDYLFAALKARGIYINIDLYTFRKFSVQEIPDLGHELGLKEIKALMPVSDKAVEVFCLFAKNLLTHVNPYTKMTWASDPALVGICPVNEASIVEFPKEDKELNALYESAFSLWLAKQDAAISKDRSAAIMHFCMEVQLKLDARLRDYLKSLGVVAPLSGSNWREAQMLTYLREHYDYVDNHMYWDHPNFPVKPWTLPMRFTQNSSIAQSAWAPRQLMPARILGKPYVITEFNFVCPNGYRAEGGLLMPAYASLQDWDAIYNFDYATVREQLTTVMRAGTFDLAVDPIGLLADRFSALIFRRRDIQPAQKTIGFVMSPDVVYATGQSRPRQFPSSYSPVGLVSRIGVADTLGDFASAKKNADVLVSEVAKSGANGVFVAEGDLVATLVTGGVIPANSHPGLKAYRSDTGQIDLRSDEGTLKVVADRVEAFVLPSERKLEGSIVSVENGPDFASVYVVSVDEKTLSRSDRILILHLTDSLNNKILFSDSSRRLLLEHGTLPHLVRRGSADLKLKLSEASAKRWKLWQVNPSGVRVKEQSMVRQGDCLSVHLESIFGNESCLAYELVRE